MLVEFPLPHTNRVVGSALLGRVVEEKVRVKTAIPYLRSFS
jgi:hypothetical protein